MLTAEKARELAGIDEAVEVLEQILSRIEDAAKGKMRTLSVREYGFGTDYLYDGKPKDKRKEVIAKLRELGFGAEVKNPATQFDDHHLIVSW